MSDTRQFKLPDVGEGLTEAEIISWRVKPGDAVQVNDIVVEIETAKSLVELPCPYAGTVAGLLVGEGDTVEVGTPIIAVTSGALSAPAAGSGPEEAAPAVDDPPAEAAVEPGLIGGPAPGGRTSVLVGYGPRTTEAKRRPRKAGAGLPGTGPTGTSSATAHQALQTAFSTDADHRSPELPVEEAEPALPQVPADTSTAGVRVLAKPPVRKLAKDLGVDLRTVHPSGAGGVVTRSDVEAHAGGVVPAERGEPPRAAAHVAGGRTRVPVKGVRKMTAQAMVSSAFTAPHVTEWVTVDATRTVRMVRQLGRHRDFRDVKVSPLLVVAKAVCLAARRTPEVNASWDEAAQEIVLEHDVNLGIAAATPRGLVVPNIKGAERMTLRELADALVELTATARAGRTQPEQMAGGTFTITNVGVFGIDAGTPILNPGETGILAVGAIARRPWVVGRRVKPRQVLTLALSFDHRVVDGAQGSRFLADVASIVHDPAQAMLH